MPKLHAIAVVAMLLTLGAASTQAVLAEVVLAQVVLAQVVPGGSSGPRPLSGPSTPAVPKAVPKPKAARPNAARTKTGASSAANSPSPKTGLPKGEGHADEGQRIFVAKCSSCHSWKGETKPARGLEKCWTTPQAFFSYVKRTMPFNKKGSLKNDEVYALMAFLLSYADITDKNLVMDASALSQVEMPSSKEALPGYCSELPLLR